MASGASDDSSIRITIHGTVASGLGEGRYFMSQREYSNQMAGKLGFAPYAGTLNIRVAAEDLSRIGELKGVQGIEISGFDREGKHFGGATVYRAELSGVKCAVVMPKITRHQGIIELIAKDRLRGILGLHDGSAVSVSVFPE